MGVEPQTARRRPQHLGNWVIGVSPIARAIKGQEPVEFFHNPNIDWLGKKWYFLAFSLIFSVAGVLSMAFWHGIPLGVEFRGGTDAQVKFAQAPDLNKIRADLDRAGLKNPRIIQFGPAANNQVLISLPEVSRQGEQADITAGKNAIINALEAPYAQEAAAGKKDFNTASMQDLQEYLVGKDPMHNGGDPRVYGDFARTLVDTRDRVFGGVLTSFDQLKAD